MTMIGMNVNGRAVSASVDPRTHLADFLREHLNLTGTHLGCEHGVCGACTLLLDDMPARSCIAFAAACHGARVTTIEGLDEDEISAELRVAFTREHALQCGYCTPGMLISARDLVLRLESADERSIRVGLSGNLCRCTGYVGIVRAVRSVIEKRRGRGILPIAGAGRSALGPVGCGHGGNVVAAKVAPIPIAKDDHALGTGAAELADFVPDKVFVEHFIVAAAPDKVFDLLGDIRQVADCLPGASLTGFPTPERLEGAVRVKLGPIVANFRGLARIERNIETRSGRIIGAGSDTRSRSSMQGEIRFRLVSIEQGAATRVELSIGYGLRGMLAYFARDGLVRGLARRLTTEFARNLAIRVSGVSGGEAEEPTKSPAGLALLVDRLQARVRKVMRTVWNR